LPDNEGSRNQEFPIRVIGPAVQDFETGFFYAGPALAILYAAEGQNLSRSVPGLAQVGIGQKEGAFRGWSWKDKFLFRTTKDLARTATPLIAKHYPGIEQDFSQITPAAAGQGQ